MDTVGNTFLRIISFLGGKSLGLFCFIVVFLAAGAISVQAEVPGPTLRIYFENDLFYDEDRDYTNAVEVRLISSELTALAKNGYLSEQLVDFLHRISFSDARGAPRYNIALGVGQQIYTPDDTQSIFFQPDDRPYAGYLYGAFALHAKHYNLLDTIELAAGIIGPSALGEQVQNTAHRTLSVNTAKGWEHQLRDEPVCMLTWSRVWRVNIQDSPRRWGWDVLPQMNFSVGTPYTRAGLGAVVRFGWNLPPDYGSSIIRPGSGVTYPEKDKSATEEFSARHKRLLEKKFRFYVFAGFDGYANVWNSFLDGNLWKESHSVEKRPLTGQLNYGLAVAIHNVQVTYTHVYRTKEFDGQGRDIHFGAITVEYRF